MNRVKALLNLDHIHAAMKGMWLQGASEYEIMYAHPGFDNYYLNALIKEWRKTISYEYPRKKRNSWIPQKRNAK